MTDACLLDDRLGYLTYPLEVGVPPTTHLLSWDGSCWSDQTIGTAESNTIVVTADAERRLWVAWADTRSVLKLRSPSGEVHNFVGNDAGVALWTGDSWVISSTAAPGGSTAQR